MFCGKDNELSTGAMWGWIGGIAGCVIGLAGGIIGTYFSIKNTNGPRERSFMIKIAIIWWMGGITFLVLLLALPNPYRWFLWIPYGVFFPLGITFANRRQQAIRQEESRNQQIDARPSHRP